MGSAVAGVRCGDVIDGSHRPGADRRVATPKHRSKYLHWSAGAFLLLNSGEVRVFVATPKVRRPTPHRA